MGRTTRDPAAREKIIEAYEANADPTPKEVEAEVEVKKDEGTKPVQEEMTFEKAEETPVQEEKIESKVEDKTEPKPKRKYAEKYETPEDLEKAYLESQKVMHQSKQKTDQLEQEFNQLKPFIDWDKVGKMMRGEPIVPSQPSPKTEVPKMDKDAFFQQFAEKGPDFLTDFTTPLAQKQTMETIRQIMPALTQTVSFRVKVDDAYSTFRDEYPHLIQFDETVGKIMLADLAKNPQKSVMKAMRDAAKQMQAHLDGYKEAGKKESEVTFEEKKRENLEPGDRANPSRTETTKPKIEEAEAPESLQDYTKQRRIFQDKGRSKVGYTYRR